MDLKTSSFEFHLQLESPFAFLRREWKAIALCGSAFCMVTGLGVFLVDPAFFYPRLQTDPLNYLLKARALIETGSTTARWTVNLPPFAYAAMPGVLRAPLLAAFTEFDHQLRAMQLANIPLLGSVAVMSAYILSWTMPPRRHWIAVAFSFAFILLSPLWLANIFMPLADAPYAALTLATLLVAVELITSPRSPRDRSALVAFGLLLFAVAFMVRFTAPVAVVFIALLGWPRWGSSRLTPVFKWGAIAAGAVFLFVLIGFNAGAIFGRYFYEPLAFLTRGDKPGMLINLLSSALPTQIVPTFQIGFLHPPISDLFNTVFFQTAADTAWAAVGALISSVLIYGMWLSRARFLPEIGYVLAALPVLALILPSTARYLMTYQPFLWIFFYAGVSALVKRLPEGGILRSRRAAAVTLIAAVAIVLGLRVWKVAGTGSERYFAVTMSRAPEYVTDVSRTFRALRNFIETLPRDKTLLVGGSGTQGRWKMISNQDYYHPDSTLAEVVQSRDVYMLIECGTLEACQAWRIWKRRMKARIVELGPVAFDSVFAVESHRSRAEVLRLYIAR